MIREFRLSPPGGGRSVSCNESGAFVGTVPLLKKSEANGRARWEPRDNNHLSKQLSTASGIPIDMASKSGGLKAICNALNDGDVARAQIATVLLSVPEPPPLSKTRRSRDDMIKFICDLHWSGMIKWDHADSNSSSQPDLPDTKSRKTEGTIAKAGYNPDEPRDERGRWTNGRDGDARLIPAQVTVAEPFIEPLFGEMIRPFPGTIDVVPPAVVPNGQPLPRAQNPHPDRPECVEEWAHAEKFCDDLKRRGKLGKEGYRGFGKAYQQCLLGQVSEDCGGNLVA